MAAGKRGIWWQTQFAKLYAVPRYTAYVTIDSAVADDKAPLAIIQVV